MKTLTTDDPKTGDKFLALFNTTEKSVSADSAKITVDLGLLGIKGTCTIKDLWSNKNPGSFSNVFAPVIKRHGSGLYRISVKK